MGRSGDGRFRMFKQPSVVLAALSLTLASSFAAEPETRTFKVLVAPGEGVSSSAFSRVTDLAATLDKQPYTIRSAEPLRPGEGRTVIIIDFDETSPENHACLMAEALSAMERIHENPPPVLVAALPPLRFASDVSLGPGQELNVYSGEDPEALAVECESGNTPKVWRSVGVQQSGGIVSFFVFQALRNSYTAQDAPVRVFWLAEKFGNFAEWTLPDCDYIEPFPCPTSNPAPPFKDIEQVAEADLTFFPVVFGKRDKGRIENPPGARVKEAELLARLTGGFVSTVSGKPGDTLVSALEKSSQGVVLTLAGPVTTDGRGRAKAQTLTIKAGVEGQPISWQRRFVVNPEGSVKPLPRGLLVPLVVPSGQLGLSYGCQTPDASPEDRTLAVTLPPEVVQAPAGQVEVYLDYPNEKGLAKQRTTLARTQGGTGSMCLPLIHAQDGMRFRIVVVDRASGWVGAANGVLSDTKGGQ